MRERPREGINEMAGYTEFEDQFLVGCSLIAEERDTDIVNVDEVIERFGLFRREHYIQRAVIGFFDSRYTRHTPWIGDFTQRNIQISAKGFRQAEQLINFGTELPTPKSSGFSIVAKENNLETISCLSECLDEISDKLRENSVSKELGEQKGVINSDIDAAKSMLKQDRFRLSSLKSLLQPTLAFIADKFAGGVLAEIAKKAMNFLIGLIT